MIHNAIATVGLLCIVYSAWLVSPALAWFAGGLSMVVVGMGWAKLKPQEAKGKE